MWIKLIWLRVENKNVCLKKAGSTLIEILLVVALISMISITLYSTLANGLKVWDRRYQVSRDEDVLIFFDKMKVDLRNAFEFSKISCEGKNDFMAFPTVVRTKVDPKSSRAKEPYIDQIGKVRYSFNKLTRQLFREQANYSRALEDKYSEKRLMAEGVNSFEVKYYYQTPQEARWYDAIMDSLPSLIKIRIDFGQGQARKKLSRVISIPFRNDSL